VKDELLAALGSVADPAKRLNLMREFLQSLALQHYDLASVLKEISCTRLQSDVRPFLQHLEDADLLEPENLRSVLE